MNRSKIIELLNIRDMDEDELRAKSNCSLDEIKKFLNILVFEGRIIRLGDGKYSLTGSRIVLSYVKNRFKDYAYVTPLKKDMRDIRLVGQDATKLLKGDCVFVRIDDDLYENNGEGSLIQIVRPVSFIEGIISKDDEGFFISSFKNIDSEVRFDVKKTSIELIEGQLVRAEIIDRRDYICYVEVTKVISKPGDRMFDLMNAIVEKGGTLTYPKDVDEQAINLATNFTDTAKDRHDLTNEFMVTIDGASTKDFDDGLSIRKTDYGYDVGVHIADVASYVKEGTPLDYEARLRATSMYFPETEISMLPTILSDDVCSLNPNAEKLTITCLLHLDHDGIYKSSEVFLSKVKSKARLTYDQVDEYIKGKKDEVDGDLKYNVDLLLECSRKILKRKKEKGQLVFGRNYPEFTLDKDGNPDTVKPRHESEAEDLVEVFMILANDEVGKLYRRDDVDFVRVTRYPAVDAPVYHVTFFDYIGFPYGGDCRLVEIGASFDSLEGWDVGLFGRFAEKGEMNIFHSHNKDGKNADKANLKGDTPYGEVSKRFAVIGLKANADLAGFFSFPKVSLEAELDWVGRCSHDNASGSLSNKESDLQFSIGMTVGF